MTAKSKKVRATGDADDVDHGYRHILRELQIELVKFQKHLISHGDRILIILEGRDSAGKDGTVKRIIEHLSPRDTRVVALGKPSTRDESEWYFQRYVPHLPAAAEFVLFNRSWYNRAGVERVMGFCTEAQYEEFMETVPVFEQMLVRSGLRLFKYYLDIDKAEQRQRLKARLTDPLKQWKMSPIDAAAQKHWKDYSAARDAMFARTHTLAAPWTIVRANDKKRARLNLIMDLLSRLDYRDKNEALLCPDPDGVFSYTQDAVMQGRIAE
ncbi:polyphosphate kinase 2 [Thiomonas bhubaneswarensis]|uniref:ADP/GDP-polyphosphate phosphotransferase n=1 Tax=Thiomonas bhubaneswarensis TaxID=339866 RepID=A0A0K6HXZ7_9BURK|nr:polyphosphate kinase 2, PA0141 family [Thiomonas bhubaneswarensis]